MFSSVMNLFKKPQTTQETAKKEENSQKSTNDDTMNEFLKTSSAQQEAISKVEIKSEVSAYFVSLEELGPRMLKIESEKEAQELVSLEIDKRIELFMEKLKNWKFSELKDEFRPPYASKFGGTDFQNQEATTIIRSIALDVLKQIGQKLLSGEFNLTTISIHIRMMQPFTILQTVAKSLHSFPIYLQLASRTNDHLERFKYVVVATLCAFHKSSSFIKPLNPILGETYELEYEDGSKVFMEQTSHHPPVSNFYLLGPNNLFKYYGFGNYKTGGGINSMKVYNTGKRWVEFKDGQKIYLNYCNEVYNNAFIGIMRLESIGEILFKDEKNGFELVIKIGGNIKKPTDFFTGEITLNKICISKVSGSYMEYVEFDDIRYWDIRENIETKAVEYSQQLPSSSVYRSDRILLAEKKIEAAQKEKEVLENLQRRDRKLRQSHSGSNH